MVAAVAVFAAAAAAAAAGGGGGGGGGAAERSPSCIAALALKFQRDSAAAPIAQPLPQTPATALGVAVLAGSILQLVSQLVGLV